MDSRAALHDALPSVDVSYRETAVDDSVGRVVGMSRVIRASLHVDDSRLSR